LFTTADKLLLAVSGGIDSVVLCALCEQAGYDYVIAHCNFQLRGEESDADEQFVRKLAAAYNRTLFVKQFNTAAYAQSNKVSVQVAAREQRYQWFHQLLEPDRGADPSASLPTRLVTAHHLDDNIETLLLNFFKGTGIAGLRGMLPLQGRLARPLLFAQKQEIKDFASENMLQWVEDSSNASDKYSRNYFRNQLIPLVQQIYPEALANLGNNLQRFREIENLYVQSIERHKKKLFSYKDDSVYIPVLQLKKLNPLPSIVYEIIKDYGFTAAQTAQVIELLDSETGRYMSSGSHRIIKNRKWIIISNLQAQDSKLLMIEASGDYNFELGRLHIEEGQKPPASIPSGASTACLDTANIRYPLLLRKWKAGDYFYPLGMKKKKKLARFFIDSKLSKIEKEKVWVLENNKKVIWVLGYRIDDRFKITAATKSMLLLRLEPNK